MAESEGLMEFEDTANEARDKEIKKILAIVDTIIESVGPTLTAKITKDDLDFAIDIDLSNELSGVLMTVFTCLRKSANINKSNVERYSAYKAVVNGVEVSIAAIVAAVKAKKIELDFKISTPLVELMTLFRNAFDEVRNGVTKFQVRNNSKNSVKRIVGENNRAVWEQTLTAYGLNNNHIPLVQGITFPPERRTGLVRSLGPLAQAILLVQEDRYFEKIEAALKNSLQMPPMAGDIARCLREAKTPGVVQGVLGELGDLLLLTTARSTQKVFLPLLLLKKMWESRETLAPHAWSFSGSMMLCNYNKAVSVWSFLIKSGGISDHIEQVVFHACFGTYLDDLGILSTITSHTAAWHKRKDVNTVFVERSTKASKKIKPIKFKLISKMAQALQTKSLGNVDPVSIGRPSFTGFKKRLYTGEFVNYMSTGKSAINFSSDPLQLQFALKKLKDTIFSERDNKKMVNCGTKSWLKLSENGNWDYCDDVPEETGSYFFGQ